MSEDTSECDILGTNFPDLADEEVNSLQKKSVEPGGKDTAQEGDPQCRTSQRHHRPSI